MTLARLTTEARNPASEEIDRLSSLEIVRLMNSEDAGVPLAVGRVAEAVAAAIDVIADRLGHGGRLIYLGAGTSGRLGVLDASECPPTFNSAPWQVVGLIAGGPTALTRAVEGAEDHPELAVEDLRRIGLSADDVVVGIATSGRTPYVIGGLRYAREAGAFAIGLSCNDDSELSAVAELTITPIVGPEVISGSTRLKAGTATKLVLNTLTTGAMVRLGKTYGNLMVDLQATNQKLADRSRRIVATLTGVSSDEAAALLDQSGGDVKTAIVMHRHRVSPDEARESLRYAGGQLRTALEAAQLPPMVPASGAMTLVLGIDGGGSKTTAWLAPGVGKGSMSPPSSILHPPLSTASPPLTTHHSPSPLPLGIGHAGPSNPQSVGWAAAQGNIDRAISLAFRAAGLPRDTVAATCLAVAGAGRDADQQRLRAWAAQRRIADKLRITHDALPLLAAGTPDGHGIALVSGTGSFAFGLDANGRTARAGGWGYLFGDEGSGYDLVRRALHAVSLAVDGRGPATSLEQGFLAALGVGTPADLLRCVYARADDRHWLASLVPVVLGAHAAGDSVASELLRAAADQLAHLVTSVARQLQWDRFPLALAGGLLVNSAPLRDAVLDRLRELGSNVESAGVVEEPVSGAVALACRMLTHSDEAESDRVPSTRPDHFPAVDSD
jgi:N-acetylmuramic acid 6-phosphate etherase